jgi:hypothetical protein
VWRTRERAEPFDAVKPPIGAWREIAADWRASSGVPS